MNMFLERRWEQLGTRTGVLLAHGGSGSASRHMAPTRFSCAGVRVSGCSGVRVYSCIRGVFACGYLCTGSRKAVRRSGGLHFGYFSFASVMRSVR
jgi:hypothetical protein